MTLIAPTIQAFFGDRLAGQLQASPRTIGSYRDTLRLLLNYTHQHTGKTPTALDWEDLNEELIAGFLQHLETARGNVPKTRNLRLTAIRSLFTFASLRHPEHAHTIARVLAIPPKRHQQRTITYLSAPEAAALINAPDPARWEGRRDRTLLTLAIYTGLRVSELTALDCGDSRSGPAPTSDAATAKAENKEQYQSSHRSDRCSPPGSPSVPVNPPTRYSRPAPAADSAPTRSRNASAPTSQPPRSPAPASTASTCTRTPCAITWTAGLCGRLACFPCWACR